MKQMCKDCFFWGRFNEELGKCRFKPPVLWTDGDGEFDWIWPETKGRDWCSKWESKPIGVA